MAFRVEEKIFISVVATTFMLADKYIDTAVQKGKIPGISGCIEHIAVVT